MSREMLRLLGRCAAAALLSVSLTAPVLAQAAAKEAPVKEAPAKGAPAKPAPQAPAREAADQPAIKMGGDKGKGFLARHEGFLKDLKAMEGNVELLLVGDSITDGWRRPQDYKNPKSWGGKKVFDDALASKYRTLNLGIGGDRTQHVIWRLQNGEVEGIKPKVAMVMIGTNNLSANTNEEIVSGVTRVVSTLNEKLPETKVLLLGIFPRAAKADDPARARIKAINAELAKLGEKNKSVKYLDIGDKFLDKEGNMPADVMPDYLHPNEKGYQIWAEAVKPTLEEMMK